ncbi:MAG: hypothetical protein SFX73_30505 [Kofleriaceae bacterium]|nr:hypothetical protein [Kofleriaceae bacterium]
MMREVVGIWMLVVAACGGGGGPSAAELDRARAIGKQLAPAELDKLVAYWTENPEPDTKALAFPMLRADAKCGARTIQVVYDPYGDRLSVALRDSAAVAQSVRTISFNGKPAWVNPEKFQPRTTLLDAGTGPKNVSGHWVDKLTATRADIFVPETDVSFEVQGSLIEARPVGDKQFDYVTKSSPAWRVKLHVFSATMAKAISDHATGVRAPRATLMLIGKHKEGIANLRAIKHPEIDPVVARFDALEKDATETLAKLGPRPFAKLESSLSVAPAGPCP